MRNRRGYRTIKTKLKELPLLIKSFAILCIIIVVRAGSSYPLPFVNTSYMKMILNMEGLAFLNSITGGSMQQMSLFALSISPYISASIIIQLMTVVIQPLEEMQKDGKTGMERYKRVTRGLAITLSIIQSAAMAIGLGARGLLVSYEPKTVVAATVIWSLGAIILIGISTLIDWLEIGNGISILLCVNILSTFPSDLMTLRDVFLYGRSTAARAVNITLITIIFLMILAVCVILYSTQKEVPVTNSKKLLGNISRSTFPIPLNTCSVMPVIFASSIISLPLVISQFAGLAKTGIPMHIMKCLTTGEWFKTESPVYTVGALLYFMLTTFFTYFYLDIGFNPYEIADNLKQSGATIPGIRPGIPTAEYIQKLSTKIALIGNTLTTGLILVMHAICNAYGIGSLSIAGTSIIIFVGVLIEEKKLISSLRITKRFKL